MESALLLLLLLIVGLSAAPKKPNVPTSTGKPLFETVIEKAGDETLVTFRSPVSAGLPNRTVKATVRWGRLIAIDEFGRGVHQDGVKT